VAVVHDAAIDAASKPARKVFVTGAGRCGECHGKMYDEWEVSAHAKAASSPLYKAAVAAAKLDLDYTQIRAPLAGAVINKHVEVGDRVQEGQPLMNLIPPSAQLYVTANFKETQLEDLRVGQAAEIRADIYPGTTFRAHVDSLSMGTGAAFALLPPENATGNWVKVVQRVPVKLVLDDPRPADKPLRIGLSVEAVIDVRDTHGPLLASRAQEEREKQLDPP